MHSFGQSGPKNYVFFLPIACSKFVPKSIHQIARFQLQNTKFSSFWEGMCPGETLYCIISVHMLEQKNVWKGTKKCVKGVCFALGCIMRVLHLGV